MFKRLLELLEFNAASSLAFFFFYKNQLLFLHMIWCMIYVSIVLNSKIFYIFILDFHFVLFVFGLNKALFMHK